MHEAPGAWPLIGRADALDRVAAALTTAKKGGLVVTGRAGEGKTRLLAAARDRAAASGVAVYWAVATDAAAGVPLAPFAPLLPRAADGAQPTAGLGLVAAALGGGERAVAVDDAHLLDPASVALIAHLLANTAVPVVLTARTVEAAWLRDLPRITLDPLTGPEIVEVLETALGGAVETALAAGLATLSDGNPLLLRELVGAALAAGTVRRDGDLWRATGPLVVATDLPAAIRSRLDRLPGAVRAAAELVALAEPVDAAMLEEVLDADALAGLEDERLLVLEAGRLRLVHPLYAESLRATTPPTRARRHRRRLAEAFDGRSRLRAAIFRLDGGLPADPDLFMAAAREASDRLDHELAGRLARAAVDAGGGFEARLLLISELPYEGRAADALELADELTGEAIDDAARLRLASARANLELVLGRVDAARATLARAVGAAASPAETAQPHAALADLAFAGGDPAEAYRRIHLARSADPDDPDLLAAQATAEAALGMTPAALADYTTAVDSAAPLVDTAPGAASGPPGPAAAATPDAAAHASSSATAGAATAADTAAPSTPASDAAAAGTAAAPGAGTGPPHAAAVGTADHATAAAAATPDAAAENPTAHAAGGAGSPMAPDAVGRAAARAAAGLAVGGRRTVAPRYLAAAGELFEAVGRPGDARRAYASFTAMAALYATNGVPLAPEPALFAADRGDAAQALRLAEAALRAGPTPAAQDAYAWALMANGRAAEAVTWSDKATSAGARNALFAFHRGMIESSLGRDGAAIDDLATALRTNPWFSPRLAPLARVTLTALSGPQ